MEDSDAYYQSLLEDDEFDQWLQRQEIIDGDFYDWSPEIDYSTLTRRERIWLDSQWGGEVGLIDPQIRFEIIDHRERYSDRLHRNIFQANINVIHNLNEVSNLLSVSESIDTAYGSVMRDLLRNAEQDDVVSGYIEGPNFPTPLFIPL